VSHGQLTQAIKTLTLLEATGQAVALSDGVVVLVQLSPLERRALPGFKAIPPQHLLYFVLLRLKNTPYGCEACLRCKDHTVQSEHALLRMDKLHYDANMRRSVHYILHIVGSRCSFQT
jgi:hypothetical protein